MTQDVSPVLVETYDLPLTGAATVPWRYLAAAEHRAEWLDDQYRILAEAAFGTDFVLTPDGDTPEGQGLLSLQADPPAGAGALRLYRMTTARQPYLAPKSAVGVERALDRLTLVAQEFDGVAARLTEDLVAAGLAAARAEAAEIGAGEDATRAEGAAEMAALYGPLTFPGAGAFFASQAPDAGAVGKRAGTQDGQAWDIVAAGDGDFNHPVTGVGVRYARSGGVVNLDDTGSLATAIRGLGRLGGGTVRLTSGKTYIVSSSVSISDYPQGADLHIDLNGATLRFVDSGLHVAAAFTTVLSTVLSDDAARGDLFIQTAIPPDAVLRGDQLEILSPAAMILGQTVQHYYRVADVADSRIYIDGSVVSDINEAQIAASGASGSIAVNVHRYGGDFSIFGGRIEHEFISTDNQAGAINVYRFNSAAACNIVTSGQCRRWFGVSYCNQSSVMGCTFGDMGFVSGDQGYDNDPAAPSGQSFGYAFMTSRVGNALFSNNHVGRGWHAPDFTRGTMYGSVKGNAFNRCSGAVSCHEGSWILDVSGNTFNSGGGILAGRCVYFYASGNQFLNMSSHSIHYSPAMMECVITGNTFKYGGYLNTGQNIVYAGTEGTPHGVRSSRPKLFAFTGNTVSADAVSTAANLLIHTGFDAVAGMTAIIMVSTNSIADAALNVRVMAGRAVVADNSLVYRDGSSVFNPIAVNSSGAAAILAQGNKAVGNSSVASSCLFAFGGAENAEYIDLIGNYSEMPGGLFRSASVGAVFRNVIGNTARRGRIRNNDGSGQTIRNLINNTCQTAPVAGDATVTQSVNNVLLAA